MEKENKNINEEELKQETNVPETEETETTAEETATEEIKEEELDPLAKAEQEIAQLKEQLLYKTAEFENYRKRTLKEKSELILNGGEKTIIAILPVLDDMERAIENAPKTEDIKALEEGWELISKKLIKTLEGMGVKKMETADADFNTDYHEAIAMVPGMGDDKKGKVIDCVQAGYTMNDKVIRHAKVAVGQ